MRIPSFLVLTTALSCSTTTLETPTDHPANPEVQPAAPRTSTQALEAGFDPFAAYGIDDEAPGTESPPAHEQGARGAQPGAGDDDAHEAGESQTTYTCPMHPEVVRKVPGKCPTCGMDLVPKRSPAPTPRDQHHH